MKARQRQCISLATLVATLGGVSLLLLTMVLGAGAAAGTVINIGSGTTTVGGNTNTSVSVTLDPADATFNGFDITIAFNKTIATVNSVSPAGGWSLIPAPVIDNVGGTVRVTGVTFSACASPCTIFTINWQGVSNGNTPLTFQVRPIRLPALAKDAGTEITRWALLPMVRTSWSTATATNTPSHRQPTPPSLPQPILP
ncbi:MAG: hypothetical protein U0837_13010 [Dehalococcoidia bacterium]